MKKTHWGGQANVYICDKQEIIAAAQNGGGGASYDWLAEQYPDMKEFDLNTSLGYLGHDLQIFRVFDELDIKKIAKHGRRLHDLKGLSTAESAEIIKIAKEYIN